MRSRLRTHFYCILQLVILNVDYLNKSYLDFVVEEVEFSGDFAIVF